MNHKQRRLKALKIAQQLKHKHMQEALNLLNKKRGALKQTQQQVSGLNQYQLDYQHQLHAVGQQGTAAHQLKAHASFVDHLAYQMNQTEVLIEASQTEVEQAHEDWQAAYQADETYKLLVEQAHTGLIDDTHKLEAREEESLLTEFVQRKAQDTLPQ